MVSSNRPTRISSNLSILEKRKTSEKNPVTKRGTQTTKEKYQKQEPHQSTLISQNEAVQQSFHKFVKSRIAGKRRKRKLEVDSQVRYLSASKLFLWSQITFSGRQFPRLLPVGFGCDGRRFIVGQCQLVDVLERVFHITVGGDGQTAAALER
jgi:hypothetical protein